MESNWKFNHIGVVVRDLDKAVEYYQSLGLVDRVSTPMTAEGKKAKLIGKFVRIGELNLEIWQPIRGETVQQEFLDSRGEGVNHICFTVDDIDKERAKLVEKGIPVIWGIQGRVAYFDTRKVGNILLELLQPPPDREIIEWLP